MSHLRYLTSYVFIYKISGSLYPLSIGFGLDVQFLIIYIEGSNVNMAATSITS